MKSSKFTLIELFVVLSIIGTILAIAVGLGFMVYLAFFSDSDLAPKSYDQYHEEVQPIQPAIEGVDFVEDSPPVI